MTTSPRPAVVLPCPLPPHEHAAARIAARIISLRQILEILAKLREHDADYRAVNALRTIPEVQRMRGEWEMCEIFQSETPSEMDLQMLRYVSQEDVDLARLAIENPY